MTRDELQARMQAICDELGIDLDTGEMEGEDGRVMGERYGFPIDQVEALPPDKKRRLDELRHDLIVDATGTRVVFSTKKLPPGSHNVDPDETEEITRLWMDVSIDAETLHRVFKLATIGGALLSGATGKAKLDPYQVHGMIHEMFPTPQHAAQALYTTEETVSVIEEENLRFAHQEQIKELAALPEEGVTISDLFGDIE